MASLLTTVNTTSLPRSRDLHAKVLEILQIPNLAAYARVLSLVEEVAHVAISSPTCPTAVALVYNCAIYRIQCTKNIRRLVKRASVSEHEEYDRRRGRGYRYKRQGVVYKVDKGEHIVAALETLRLEEYMAEQEQASRRKRVQWADRLEKDGMFGPQGRVGVMP
ncbi:hypothetical protein GGR50DRAFT_694384 [Xylaria sp. CBS 124048]|nr:hypothetical protein GGR50DRAFT_694384 [Xylaria sp. CBS 124048]